MIIPDIASITYVAWSEPEYETPKATVKLTFSSKIAFTTNYPIHAKIKIQYFREEENDTNVFVHIVNPPAQAFKYPLDETPYSGLIKIIKSNGVGDGELDLEFTSAGSYGLAIFSGSSDYFGNMTVAYAGQNKEVINISPPETRFLIESTIRGFGLSLIPISIILAIFKTPSVSAHNDVSAILFFPKGISEKNKTLGYHAKNLHHRLIVNHKTKPTKAFYLTPNSDGWKLIESNQELWVSEVVDSRNYRIDDQKFTEKYCKKQGWLLMKKIATERDLVEKD